MNGCMKLKVGDKHKRKNGCYASLRMSMRSSLLALQ